MNRARAILAVACVLWASLLTAHSFGAQTVHKCKHATHLRVVAAKLDAKLIDAPKVSISNVDHAACRNYPTYDGPASVFVLGDRSGLQLLPDAAAYVKGAFGAFSGPVTVEHTVGGVFVPYRSFSDAARAKVEAELP